MKASLKFEEGYRFSGLTEAGLPIAFDTTAAGGGSNTAPSPVESVLLAAGACSAMDVIGMIRKARKEIVSFEVHLSGARATEHPKVFTKIHMDFRITSPDLTLQELRRFIDLSHSKYCSVSILLARGGCEITTNAQIKHPHSQVGSP